MVVGPLHDRNQSVNEADQAVVRRRAVDDGVDERPQSAAARLGCSACSRPFLHQSGLNDVQEHTDVRLCRSSVVLEHVAQKNECALIDLTAAAAANRNYEMR